MPVHNFSYSPFWKLLRVKLIIYACPLLPQFSVWLVHCSTGGVKNILEVSWVWRGIAKTRDLTNRCFEHSQVIRYIELAHALVWLGAICLMMRFDCQLLRSKIDSFLLFVSFFLFLFAKSKSDVTCSQSKNQQARAPLRPLPALASQAP